MLQPPNRQVEEKLNYVSPDSVAALVPATGSVLVLCDKDGTLDFKVPNPELAFVTPEASMALVRLMDNQDFDVVAISGRDVEWLQKLMGPAAVHPEMTLIGGHGHQRKSRGSDQVEMTVDSRMQMLLEDTAAQVVATLRGAGHLVKDRPSDDPGLCMEIKVGSIALHYRTAPKSEEQARATFGALTQEFVDAGTHKIEDGDCVIELKLKGKNKGVAADEEMARANPDFVMVLGDDTTDLDMMRSVAASGRPHVLVFVGDRPFKPGEVDGISVMRVKDPDEIKALFGTIAENREIPPVATPVADMAMDPYYREHCLG